MKISSYRDLDVYRMAMGVAMVIFRLTRDFPREETYSLVDQMRRSSRSVCANIAEAWRRRRYKAAFINKMNEAETEAEETRVWLEFSLRCEYIGRNTFEELDEEYGHIIGKLVRMIVNPGNWVIER